ncbi:hypothetical protein BDW62DRAFT_218360 [Aspergillus aurantiobrunneus]
MAKLSQPRTPTSKSAMAVNRDDLAICKRDRDFTNLLDLKHEHHSTFLKRLRTHVEFFHTWKELRDSAAARELCISQFLDIYGVEYWGVQNRTKYIMSDSLTRGDEVHYPEDSAEIKKILILLLKKKADSVSKDIQVEEPGSSQHVATVASGTAPSTRAAPLEDAGKDDGVKDTEDEPPRRLGARHVKKRITTEAGINITPTGDTSSLTSLDSLSTATRTAAPMTSKMSTLGLIDGSLAKALQSKYRRDTFFLVTADRNVPLNAAPAWVGFQIFKSASSFLLDMGRERGLEKRWWTPDAQMEIEGGAGVDRADYASAARGVISMASVKAEWSSDEVIVRWGNESDWEIVMQLIQKAWVAKEFGQSVVDLFRIQVILHIVG